RRLGLRRRRRTEFDLRSLLLLGQRNYDNWSGQPLGKKHQRQQHQAVRREGDPNRFPAPVTGDIFAQVADEQVQLTVQDGRRDRGFRRFTNWRFHHWNDNTSRARSSCFYCLIRTRVMRLPCSRLLEETAKTVDFLGFRAKLQGLALQLFTKVSGRRSSR